MSDDDEDAPQLPADTLAILQKFYADRDLRNEVLQNTENDSLKEISLFDENWQLSQFWYDEGTINTIVKIVKNTLPENGTIALISCPTLYVPIRKALDENCTVKLLEYDDRFQAYGSNFIHYDFNHPLKVPKDLNKYFDIVIADPPFLSEECFSKTCETVKFLSKEKIIICTGTVMCDVVRNLLPDVKMCKFKPQHRNNLANEFSSYSNFDLDDKAS